jgi:cell division protein FtsQ
VNRLLSDRRLLERRRAIVVERVRRRRRVLLAVVVAVVASVGLYQLARSPLFGLTEVRVEGAGPDLRAAVLSAANVRSGQPYLDIDPGAVRRRVEALPAVASARVARSYPSSLRIVVSERVPTAVVSSGGAYWLVAADGMVLRRLAGRPAPGRGALPLVADVPLPPGVGPGTRLPPDNPLANALSALGHMDPVLKRQVAAVTAGSIDSLQLGLRDGAVVLYGVAEQQAAKDAAVLLVRSKLRAEGKKVVRIDVRSPSTPIVKETAIGNAQR